MIANQQRNIPRQLTPFIGRDEELARLLDRLYSPDCRLLTLIGSGGSGKTRLAIEMANRLSDGFVDGVYFTVLQSVALPNHLPSAIADAMHYVMRGQGAPKDQLFQYLRDKNCLLILDNFEHLIASASFVSDLLAAAPGIKIVVTSREVLNLREEWLFSVGGLRVPPDNEPHQSREYDAVSLFADHARRVRHDFSLQDERFQVTRICRLVDGLPLAIELAASWLKYMSCAQIAEDITHNIDFLETNLRNLPERHRSIRAVFDQSWKLLTEEEQQVFKRLAVFPGDFERDAAAQVTGASLHTLTALVDKSMLWFDTGGRYKMHELLRQYAEKQLNENPTALYEAQERFGDYYAHFLHSREDAMKGGNQIAAMQEIAAELDNIRAAWQWAVEHQTIDFFHKSLESLYMFYQFKSRYAEGAELLQVVSQQLFYDEKPEEFQLWTGLEVHRGWFLIRLGRLDEARTTLLRCLERHRQLNYPSISGHATDARLALGIIAMIRGDHDRAHTCGEEARQFAEAHNNLWNLAFAYYVLANATLALGDLDTAKQYADEACRLAEAEGDQWALAYPLNVCGSIARAAGKYDEASYYYRRSYGIRQEFDDPEGMAIALNRLGEIALLRDEIDEAGRCFKQSLVIYENIDDRGGWADALGGLGTVACKRADYAVASEYFYRALQTAHEIQYFPLIFSLLIHIAELFLQTGRAAPGQKVLALVLNHPSSDQETKAQARAALRDQTPSDDLAVSPDLETTIQQVMTQLEQSAAVTQPADAQQALAEPLTERELVVLRLLAEGLSNKDIAESLTVVIGTVKAHNNRIYGKLGVKNRTQAVARARELNLL